jgi:prepilin-type processing-associated H-X9-DG protein/prepilin-type N-terminal cleavage/methylation domain-containing protein
MNSRSSTRGFTLLELCVVLLIVVLVAGLVLPMIHYGREEARRIQCLGNLRQLATATHIYASSHDGYYPPAYKQEKRDGVRYRQAWDFTWVKDGSGMHCQPGLLWEYGTDKRVMQCPSCESAANWEDDPYTGYNYNTSYIGRDNGRPAHISEVLKPAECVLFGDAGWAGGANKFMRSPYPSPYDTGFSARYAGTQAFRHNGKCNVVYCDGHAESRSERFTDANVAEGTGFLSPDNSLYDLQ